MVALWATLFLVESYNYKKIQKQQEQEKIIKIQKAFSDISVLTKSFSVYDKTDEKEIYNKNGGEILPLASLSKMMTAVVALEKNNLNDTIVVLKNSPEESANSALFLNEKWKLGDLIKFTLISSSNDGALALAKETDFIVNMNKKTVSLGMKNCFFINPTGLDIDSERAGSYGTALDMNILASYAIEKYPEIFSSTNISNTSFKSLSGQVHNVKNTNTIVGKIPNLILSKTGYTTLAGGNLTIVFKNKVGHIIIITLLGSTKEGRFADMGKLVSVANIL